MRAMLHFFYKGFARQKCVAHSVMVLIALSMVLSISSSVRKRLNTIDKVLNLLDILWSIFMHLLHFWYLLLHALLDLIYKGYIVLCVLSFDKFWFAVFPHCHFLSNILKMVRYYLLHFHIWAELCCWRVILESKWSTEKKIHNKISVTWN